MADVATQAAPLLDQQAQERGTRYAEPMVPVGYSEAQKGAEELGTRLYKGGQYESALSSKDAMLQELFNYDKRLEQQNYSPFPKTTLSSGQTYIENPADIYRGAGSYMSALGGTANATQRAIMGVEQDYQNAIGQLIGRYIDFATLAEKRKQREEDKKTAEQDTLLKVMEITGGDWTDAQGNVHHLPTPEERAALEKKYRAGAGGTTAEDVSILESILRETPSAGEQSAIPQSPLVTEPKPAYSPSGGIGSLSNGGQWMFDGQDWVPSGQTPSLESFWRNQ